MSSLKSFFWRDGHGREYLLDRGQTALVAVIILLMVMLAIPLELTNQAIGQSSITVNGVYATQALSAARSGVSDYESHIAANPSYPTQYCSTTFGCTSGVDSSNPAFVNKFDPACTSSSATASGWELVSGTVTGKNSEFQYVVDNTHVPTTGGTGVVYVYVMGRAGIGGNYICRSLKTAITVKVPAANQSIGFSYTTDQQVQTLGCPASSDTSMTVTLQGGSGGYAASYDSAGSVMEGGAPGMGGVVHFVVPLQIVPTQQGGTTLGIPPGAFGGQEPYAPCSTSNPTFVVAVGGQGQSCSGSPLPNPSSNGLAGGWSAANYKGGAGGTTGSTSCAPSSDQGGAGTGAGGATVLAECVNNPCNASNLSSSEIIAVASGGGGAGGAGAQSAGVPIATTGGSGGNGNGGGYFDQGNSHIGQYGESGTTSWWGHETPPSPGLGGVGAIGGGNGGNGGGSSHSGSGGGGGGGGNGGTNGNGGNNWTDPSGNVYYSGGSGGGGGASIVRGNIAREVLMFASGQVATGNGQHLGNGAASVTFSQTAIVPPPASPAWPNDNAYGGPYVSAPGGMSIVGCISGPNASSPIDIPSGMNGKMLVVTAGGAGAPGNGETTGGPGATVATEYNVVNGTVTDASGTPHTHITADVGCQGSYNVGGSQPGGVSPYNSNNGNGGNGGAGDGEGTSGYAGNGGGGATAVCLGQSSCSPNSQLLVTAGGGGGGGGYYAGSKDSPGAPASVCQNSSSSAGTATLAVGGDGGSGATLSSASTATSSPNGTIYEGYSGTGGSSSGGGQGGYISPGTGGSGGHAGSSGSSSSGGQGADDGDVYCGYQDGGGGGGGYTGGGGGAANDSYSARQVGGGGGGGSSWISSLAEYEAGGAANPANGYVEVSFVPSSTCSFQCNAWSAPGQIDNGTNLNSVSCTTYAFCVAVDNNHSFTYNGTVWSVSSPNIDPNTIESVSCYPPTGTTANCMAVDGSGDYLIYNGTNWSSPAAIPGDSGNTLHSISCTAGPTCVAVDNNHAYLYSAGSWGSPSSIDPSHSMTAVSCTSSKFCVAVDNNGNGLVYNGTNWSSPVSVGTTNQLNSVSCAINSSSQPFCIAVTNHHAYQYSGGIWSVSSGPTGAGSAIDTGNNNGNINSVSCTSSYCEAVDNNGNAITYDVSSHTWSSTIFVDSGILNPNPANQHNVTAVACVTTPSDYCAAVDNNGNALSYGQVEVAVPALFSNVAIAVPNYASRAIVMTVGGQGGDGGTFGGYPQSGNSPSLNNIGFLYGPTQEQGGAGGHGGVAVGTVPVTQGSSLYVCGGTPGVSGAQNLNAYFPSSTLGWLPGTTGIGAGSASNGAAPTGGTASYGGGGGAGTEVSTSSGCGIPGDALIFAAGGGGGGGGGGSRGSMGGNGGSGSATFNLSHSTPTLGSGSGVAGALGSAGYGSGDSGAYGTTDSGGGGGGGAGSSAAGSSGSTASSTSSLGGGGGSSGQSAASSSATDTIFGANPVGPQLWSWPAGLPVSLYQGGGFSSLGQEDMGGQCGGIANCPIFFNVTGVGGTGMGYALIAWGSHKIPTNGPPTFTAIVTEPNSLYNTSW